jgi:hypothetical protein
MYRGRASRTRASCATASVVLPVRGHVLGALARAAASSTPTGKSVGHLPRRLTPRPTGDQTAPPSQTRADAGRHRRLYARRERALARSYRSKRAAPYTPAHRQLAELLRRLRDSNPGPCCCTRASVRSASIPGRKRPVGIGNQSRGERRPTVTVRSGSAPRRRAASRDRWRGDRGRRHRRRTPAGRGR